MDLVMKTLQQLLMKKKTPMYKGPSVNVTLGPFVTVLHYQCGSLFLISQFFRRFS